MANETDNINVNVGINPSGAEAGSRRSRKAIKDNVDEAKQLEAAFRRLQQSIDPAYSAQEKYNKSLADNRRLLAAGKITADEYRAGMAAATAELNRARTALEQNSSANRAAAAAARQAAQEAKQQALETARAARQAAREKAVEEKKAAAEARKAAAEQRAQEREAARQAAAEVKRLAREKAAAEKQAAREAADEVKRQKAAERAANRAAAEAAKQAARDRALADRMARDAARAATQAANEAAAAARRQADSYRQLRASIDPAWAAMQRYKDTMRQAIILLRENIITMAQYIAIQRQARIALDLNNRMMGRSNMIYTQLGYQAQDVTASLASGIHPLVILAQQGGQTAAALSMMGGTMGRVASFIAGPYGAAIIGITLLIGMMMQKKRDAARATKDLMDAEERRRMTVIELTKALKDFTKEQIKANESEEEGLRIKQALAAEENAKAKAEIARLDQRIATLKKQMAESAKSTADPEQGGAGAMAAYAKEIQRLNEARAAQLVIANMTESSITELTIQQAKRRAEAVADESEAIKQKFEANIDLIEQEYRLSKQTDADYLRMQERIVQVTKAKEAAEKAYADSKKESNKQDKASHEQTSFGSIVDGGRMTSGFGNRSKPNARASSNHMGQDWAVPVGTSVKAPAAGVVQDMGYSPELGKWVILAHGGGTTTRYGHLSDNSLMQKGQRVEQGQTFARSGNTGNSTGPHVHYEVRVNGKPVDPAKGIFGTDQLAAENKGADELARIQENALRDNIANIELQQQMAEDDYQEQLRLQDEKILALRVFYGEEAQEVKDAHRERVRMEQQHARELLRINRENIRARLEQAQAEETSRQNSRAAGGQMASDTLDTAVSMGAVQQGRQEIEARRAILAQIYADEVAHQQRMYDLKVKALQDELALLPPQSVEANKINAQIETFKAEHDRRMQEMAVRNQVDRHRLDLEYARASAAMWQTVGDTVEQGMNQTFQAIWTRSGGAIQAIINMGDQLVFAMAEWGIKMLRDWAVNEAAKTNIALFGSARRKAIVAGEELTKRTVILSTAATDQAVEAAKTGAALTGQAIRTGAAVTGAATQTAVSAAAGTSEIATNAAASAAGAYKSTVVIPFIGPVAAPAAAALALAAVMGFTALIRSAAGGYGSVEGDQLMQVHNKEMILPAWIAEPFRQSLRRPSSQGLITSAGVSGAEARSATHMTGGDTNFTYSPQYGGSGGMGMEEMLRRDGNYFRRWVRNEMRNSRLEFPR